MFLLDWIKVLFLSAGVLYRAVMCSFLNHRNCDACCLKLQNFKTLGHASIDY